MELLYQDDRVVVCVKEPGILSTDEPGGLPSLLRTELGDENIRTVHRLDQSVGGVMVLARTKRAAADLSAQIRDGQFHKEYLAVLTGVPAEKTGTFRDFLIRDTKTHRTRTASPETPGAKEAILHYAVLETKDNLSLVKIALETGRTHQIRVQFASRGLPLWGDGRYGTLEPQPVALFSCGLSFLHPRTKKRLRFMREAPARIPFTLFFEGTESAPLPFFGVKSDSSTKID